VRHFLRLRDIKFCNIQLILQCFIALAPYLKTIKIGVGPPFILWINLSFAPLLSIRLKNQLEFFS